MNASRRLFAIALSGALLISAAASAPAAARRPPAPRLGAAALAEASAAQRAHIAPDLLALVAEHRRDAAAGAAGPFQSSNPTLLLDAGGDQVAVQITAQDVESLSAPLQLRGLTVLGSAPALHLIEGMIPIQNLPGLADLAGQGLFGVVAIGAPQRGSGSVTSQADVVHEAERVRADPAGYDGSGLCVGILSDSYDRLGGAAAGVASGDLPAVDVRREGPANGSDEGRAMAELAHDLAPGAGIAFASAFYGQAAFGDSIRDLAAPGGAGCAVITDDIFYFDEPLFQDGLIAQAIDEVVRQHGTAYFALAGNLARQSYESAGLRPAADPSLPGAFHDFDPGPGVDTRQRISIAANATAIITLQWDDPFFTAAGVDTDIDIALLAAGTDTVLASATSDNLVSRVPSERFVFANNTGDTQFDVLIQLFAGPAPTKLKYVNYGANSSTPITFNEHGTGSGTLIPHAAAGLGRGVGAVHYYDQGNPAGFTSAGPNTILFAADGARLAAPEVRQKPDFMAIQGTDTTFFGGDADGNGFPNFFGTSAAAPHAAAIAALVKQANPSFTPAQIYTRLEASARDMHTAGRDELTGLGLINAYDAVFGPPPAVSALPFSDPIEGGGLGRAWETGSTGAGRVRVSAAGGPASGAGHVILDSALGGLSGRNELTLRLDLSHWREVTLAFDQREFSDADHAMPATFSGSSDSDGVALSVDGVSWHRVVSLTGAASADNYQAFSLSLSEIAAARGLSLGADVWVRLQQFGSASFSAGAPAGMAFDNIQVGGTYVNSAPTLSAGADLELPAISEDVADAANAGATVAELIAGRAGDSDAGDALGVAVIGAAAEGGAWQYALDGGGWADLGSPTAAAARLLGPTARIRLAPNLNANGVITTGLTLRLWDGSDGLAGGTTADATGAGGASPFSAASIGLGIRITPVNDAPAAAGALADQVAPAGQAFSLTVPPSTFIDVDLGDTLSYSATTAGGDGLPGWLSFDPATRTLSGTPAPADRGQVTIAVQARDAAGATAAAGFTLTVEVRRLYMPLIHR